MKQPDCLQGDIKEQCGSMTISFDVVECGIKELCEWNDILGIKKRRDVLNEDQFFTTGSYGLSISKIERGTGFNNFQCILK